MVTRTTPTRSSTKATPNSKVDGRRLRAARNHEAVVGAVLDIVRERPREAMHLPGAAEVAARAGVSERTVFRHFADLDSLFMAAAARQRPTHETYLAPRPDAPDVAARIAAVVRLRSKLYEEIAPVRRVAIHLSHTRPIVVEQLAQAYSAARAQVADVFAPELARVDTKQRQLLLDALDLALSWTSWDALRTVHGCSVERTRKVITETMTALLATVPKTKRR
jgi:AcrR family transcriptional regulator